MPTGRKLRAPKPLMSEAEAQAILGEFKTPKVEPEKLRPDLQDEDYPLELMWQENLKLATAEREEKRLRGLANMDASRPGMTAARARHLQQLYDEFEAVADEPEEPVAAKGPLAYLAQEILNLSLWVNELDSLEMFHWWDLAYEEVRRYFKAEKANLPREAKLKVLLELQALRTRREVVEQLNQGGAQLSPTSPQEQEEPTRETEAFEELPPKPELRSSRHIYSRLVHATVPEKDARVMEVRKVLRDPKLGLSRARVNKLIGAKPGVEVEFNRGAEVRQAERLQAIQSQLEDEGVLAAKPVKPPVPKVISQRALGYYQGLGVEKYERTFFRNWPYQTKRGVYLDSLDLIVESLTSWRRNLTDFITDAPTLLTYRVALDEVAKQRKFLIKHFNQENGSTSRDLSEGRFKLDAVDELRGSLQERIAELERYYPQAKLNTEAKKALVSKYEQDWKERLKALYAHVEATKPSASAVCNRM